MMNAVNQKRHSKMFRIAYALRLAKRWKRAVWFARYMYSRMMADLIDLEWSAMCFGGYLWLENLHRLR